MTQSNVTAVQNLLSEAEALLNDFNQIMPESESDEDQEPEPQTIREALTNMVDKLREMQAIANSETQK